MRQTIFITGGATGIGAATVEKFISEGWNVTFMDINSARAEELVSRLGNPDTLLYVQGDTRSRSDLKKAVEGAVARFGELNAVFANAGIHQNNTLLTISDQDLERIIDINILGTIRTLQATVPELIKAGGGSVVINCSDQWLVGKPDSFAYGMTKGALGQITRSLSIDLGPEGIRVNAVCPGSIDTPLLEGAMRRFSALNGVTYEEMMETEASLYARRKVGQPQEVANLVYFLASDDSSFCTGSHYVIDGGLTAR